MESIDAKKFMVERFLSSETTVRKESVREIVNKDDLQC